MTEPIRDLLALIGLACVVSTPIVLALLAMAGRREEEDEPVIPPNANWVEVVRAYYPDFHTNHAEPADPVRDLAARAKGGDE